MSISSSPKAEIEAALRKAIRAVVIDCVVDDYMAEAGAAATVMDAPLIIARAKDILCAA